MAVGRQSVAFAAYYDQFAANRPHGGRVGHRWTITLENGQELDGVPWADFIVNMEEPVFYLTNQDVTRCINFSSVRSAVRHSVPLLKLGAGFEVHRCTEQRHTPWGLPLVPPMNLVEIRRGGRLVCLATGEGVEGWSEMADRLRRELADALSRRLHRTGSEAQLAYRNGFLAALRGDL